MWIWPEKFQSNPFWLFVQLCFLSIILWSIATNGQLEFVHEGTWFWNNVHRCVSTTLYSFSSLGICFQSLLNEEGNQDIMGRFWLTRMLKGKEDLWHVIILAKVPRVFCSCIALCVCVHIYAHVQIIHSSSILFLVLRWPAELFVY